MNRISQDELDKIIRLDALWNCNSDDGEMASFEKMDLSGLIFNGCILKRIHFEDCNLKNCSFEHCVFLSCIFENCDLSNAKFYTVIFEGLPQDDKCIFQNCNISGYSESGELSFLNTLFELCIFNSFYTPYLRVINSTIENCKFINATNFESSEIFACKFKNSFFDECQADCSKIEFGEFNNCTFTNVNIDHSKFNNNLFVDSNISANFYGSSLNDCKFLNTNLIGSNMSFCDFTGCMFHETDLFESTIKGAKGLVAKSVAINNTTDNKSLSVTNLVSNLITIEGASEEDILRKIKEQTYSEVGQDGRPIDIDKYKLKQTKQ